MLPHHSALGQVYEFPSGNTSAAAVEVNAENSKGPTTAAQTSSAHTASTSSPDSSASSFGTTGIALVVTGCFFVMLLVLAIAVCLRRHQLRFSACEQSKANRKVVKDVEADGSIPEADESDPKVLKRTASKVQALSTFNDDDSYICSGVDAAWCHPF